VLAINMQSLRACGVSAQTDKRIFLVITTPAPPLKGGDFLGDFFALVAKFLREPPGGAKRAKHRAKHERTVLRSKNKGTKCTFVVSEPHQLWAQWVRWRPCEAGARPNFTDSNNKML
jgi:hypothetical protein